MTATTCAIAPITYRSNNLVVALSSCDACEDAEDWLESSDDNELLRLRRGLSPGILLCSVTGS